MYNHQLDAFLKVADLGSFTKAGNAMYISSTAVIQQINLLEERCQAKLFIRSHHGVRLTPAGRILYRDAQTLIQFAAATLERVRSLEETAQTTVRFGTSMLWKCRLLPEIWAQASILCPQLKIEILPIPESSSRERLFADLGVRYDIIEGTYGTIRYPHLCRFLELMKTPFCCAVAKKHRLADRKSLSLEDLQGEKLIMIMPGVSAEADRLRQEILKAHPQIEIVDSSWYGMDTFMQCEVEPYVLITHEVYADIHSTLVTIPLAMDLTMPYGLMYAKDPSPAVRLFLKMAEEVCFGKEEKDHQPAGTDLEAVSRNSHGS